MKKSLLTLACLLSILSGAGAQVPNEPYLVTTVGGITYTLKGADADTVCITGYTRDIPKDLTISSPITIDGRDRYVCIDTDIENMVSPLLGSGITGLKVVGKVNLGQKYAFAGITTLKTVDMSEATPYSDTASTFATEGFLNCVAIEKIKFNPELEEIPDYCFMNCLALRTVEIPPALKELQHQFFNCPNLWRIDIPENSKLEKMHLGYSQIGLWKMTVPATVKAASFNDLRSLVSVEFLGADTWAGGFRECTALKSVKLPSRQKEIQSSAFEECTSLTAIELPATVQTLGGGAFKGCTSLRTITLPADNSITNIDNSAFNGCYALEDFALQLPNITRIGYDAFHDCSITSIELGSNLQSIGERAFKNAKQLKTVKFAEGCGLKELPDETFSGSGITEAIIPDCVGKLGINIFQGCKNLKKIKFPANEDFKTIRANFTAECGNIEEVILPDNILMIEPNAFANNKIKEVVLPKKLISLGNRTDGFRSFANNEITKITWPDNDLFTHIPMNMFQGNKLTEVTNLPANIEKIMDNAFDTNEITTVTLPENLKEIGYGSFQNNKLGEVRIPASVEKIGYFAFCSNTLQKVILEADEEHNGTNKSINSYAFQSSKPDAPALTLLESHCTVPPEMMDKSAFNDLTYKNTILHIPEGCEEAYKKAIGWKEFYHVEAAVEEIATDSADIAPEYYTLQGVRTLNPAPGEIYIVRRGSKVTKEIAR